MSTAVDSSALLTIFKGEAGHEAWIACLAERAATGPLVACAVVWTEVGGFFTDLERLRENMALLMVDFSAITAETAHRAGRLFRAYRNAGGPREHLVPDFLVGAHAERQCRGLVAVDRGFYRRYFRELEIISPR
jgi:hypothetical protein